MNNNAWVRSVANTCGELEREAKSRKYNVIEAFAVMTFCLVVLWLYAYPLGVLMKIESVNAIANVMLVVGALYLLFVSPFVHRDTLASWGLGDPVVLYRSLTQGRLAARILFALALIAIVAGLTIVFYVQWQEVAKFLFHMRRDAAEAMKTTPLGKAGIAWLGFVLAVFFGTCVVRYDNFPHALFTAVKLLAVLATALYLGALAAIGPKAFADFDPSKFSLDVFGYVFWGAIQQLLFSSYFGTRLRKGFAPAKDSKYRNRKRIAVAILNGSFFGLIHINSWYLVAVTWLLGCFLSYVFMSDRNRNLIALGFVHGFLGSSLGWLFSSGKGKIEVEMSVGPWNTDGFDLPTAIVTIPLIVAFGTFIIYAYRSWEEE